MMTIRKGSACILVSVLVVVLLSVASIVTEALTTTKKLASYRHQHHLTDLQRRSLTRTSLYYATSSHHTIRRLEDNIQKQHVVQEHENKEDAVAKRQKSNTISRRRMKRQSLKHKKDGLPPKSTPSSSSSSSESSLKELLIKVRSYCPKGDEDMIIRAYQLSNKVHITRMREWDPHNVQPHHHDHPTIDIAHIIADMKLDIESIVAALLSNVLDDSDITAAAAAAETAVLAAGTKITHKQIEVEFGRNIASLVQGVHKLSTIKYTLNSKNNDAETYLKMIVSISKDIRVILVKLAERTHTSRYILPILKLAHQSQQKSSHQRLNGLCNELLHIYAPLAHRLGMYRIKTELEDTSFKYLKPVEYDNIVTQVLLQQQRRQEYTSNVITLLEQQLQNQLRQQVENGRVETTLVVGGGEATPDANGRRNLYQVTGRAKSYYSIYQKMIVKEKKYVSDIQDLMAFRILVHTVEECYRALSTVQSIWEPLPGRFKDYIAKPKLNGYQSLHTTVIGPDDTYIEIQIRTHEMHQIAEGGIAAHWQYKQQNRRGGGSGGGGRSSSNSEKRTKDELERIEWLRQLVDSVQNSNDPNEIISGNQTTTSQGQLFESEVFCFSPQGHLFALAKGSTIVDFAYRIHSDLGNHCVGAKVNDKMVPLKYTIQDGDTVEIVQSSSQTPHRSWLKFVQTSKARSKIKSYLLAQQREDNISQGKDLLDMELKKSQASLMSRDSISRELKEGLPRVVSQFGFRDEEFLFAAIGSGRVSPKSIISEIFRDLQPQQQQHQSQNNDNLLTNDDMALQAIRENSAKRASSGVRTKNDGIVVGGGRNMLISYCRNCNPIHGEPIQAVVTQGRGFKVHRVDCHHLREADKQRIVDAKWDTSIIKNGNEASSKKAVARLVRLDVYFEDTPGTMAGMSSAISSVKAVAIDSVSVKQLSNGQGLARFGIMIPTVDEFDKVIRNLEQERGVLSVTRR